MNSRRVWTLLVGFPLLCGMIGCGEKPNAAVEEPEPLASEQEATEKPKVAMENPEMAIAPFDADQAKQHQQAWAEHLGVPVETTNSIGMKLKLIPPGEFMMGSPESGDDAESNEKPQHKVRITRPFYFGVYEVTEAEYKKVRGELPSKFQGASNPVKLVTWDETAEFCKRLSAKEGKTYRLPTEAEWEYACRAGTTTRYCFGDDSASLGEYAWYDENSDGKTHSAGGKKPNAWGLHDMHGNLWERCADWYDTDYYAVSPTDDPTGPETGTFRVARSGCWWSAAESCRAADRSRRGPANRGSNLGFRVAAEPAGLLGKKHGSEAESGNR